MLDPSIDVVGSVLARAAVCGEAQRRSPWQPVEVNTGANGPAQAGELTHLEQGKGAAQGEQPERGLHLDLAAPCAADPAGEERSLLVTAV